METGGWRSKEAADQQAAGGMTSFAGFMAALSVLSVYLSVTQSPWWLGASVVLGVLAVRTWWRLRESERERGPNANPGNAEPDDEARRESRPP